MSAALFMIAVACYVAGSVAGAMLDDPTGRLLVSLAVQTVQLLRHLDRTKFAPVLYLVSRAGELLPEVPDDVPVYVLPHDEIERHIDSPPI
mgnify:CR=1 FL=1